MPKNHQPMHYNHTQFNHNNHFAKGANPQFGEFNHKNSAFKNTKQPDKNPKIVHNSPKSTFDKNFKMHQRPHNFELKKDNHKNFYNFKGQKPNNLNNSQMPQENPQDDTINEKPQAPAQNIE